MIDLFITSGRRPELFVKTIESFRQHCSDLDLIDKWICIDDGTDEKWRKKLEEKFPFFIWIYKPTNEVGHAKSLNMLTQLFKTKYIIRLEDDWCFIKSGHFVRDCIEILDMCPSLGQVMFNKNYQEAADDNLLGGVAQKTPTDLEYFLHECIPNAEDQAVWREKNGLGRSVLLSWPHFSLQPSVTRVSAVRECGSFCETSSYFEYQFALNYTKLGWKTGFLPTCYCEHIGRRLNDYSGALNAYELLNQEHFGRAPRPLTATSFYWHNNEKK